MEKITLRRGELEFSALAQGEGDVVLFLHGFPDTPYTWQEQIEAVSAAGYRCVAPFLRGYEQSSQPSNGDYGLLALVDDVLSWVDLITDQKVHLVGHDWGATIAFAAAAKSPDKFRSLTAISVPHPGEFARLFMEYPQQSLNSQYIIDFQDPTSTERVAANDFEYLRRLWSVWSPNLTANSSALTKMLEQFRVPHVLDSALSYYRQALQMSPEVAVQNQSLLNQKVSVSCLGIAGLQDGCIVPALYRAAMSEDVFESTYSLLVLEEAGHFPHLEMADQVSSALIDWFKSN